MCVNSMLSVNLDCSREKNKRFAEQGAALVLACCLGLVSKEDLIKDGSILE